MWGAREGRVPTDEPGPLLSVRSGVLTSGKSTSVSPGDIPVPTCTHPMDAGVDACVTQAWEVSWEHWIPEALPALLGYRGSPSTGGAVLTGMQAAWSCW